MTMLSRFHLIRNVTDRRTNRRMGGRMDGHIAISISHVSVLTRDKNTNIADRVVTGLMHGSRSFSLPIGIIV